MIREVQNQSFDREGRALVDPFGRAITYLRVSVTDRCDFRCVYCMSEHMTFLPKADLLTLEELDRLCSAFVARGVRKLRLTGGEPLVRPNVMALVRSLRDGGLTILMIEHHVHAVAGLSDRLLVLNFGKMIAEGVPTKVLRDPAVVAAYLGDETEARA